MAYITNIKTDLYMVSSFTIFLRSKLIIALSFKWKLQHLVFNIVFATSFSPTEILGYTTTQYDVRTQIYLNNKCIEIVRRCLNKSD